jgi:glycosyltransferase involved in cell wall biosynthesis
VKVAYLTNQYPKISHTFIRREIAGLERAGVEVERVSVRPSRERLVDERDLAELGRTRVLLGRGALGLLPDALAVCVSRPLRVLQALNTALGMSRRSGRGLPYHLAYLAEACVLLRWTARAGVEHVHVHFATNPTDVALLCHALGGPPFSFTAHGTADLGAAGASSLPAKIAAAAFVVAVCDDGRRRLAAHTPPGHEHKLHVVRCGVDEQFLDAARAAVPEAPRLACVARLSPEKGLDVLLRAARRLADEGLDFELSLVGDGSERLPLERLAHNLGLDGRVRLLGWRSGDEVRATLLQARALVVSSHSEGLPVVIMEALALGRPVISTAVGGIPELVVQGECGWLVPAGSERGLADAMRAALTLPTAELDVLGARGAQRVAAEHSAGRQAERMARLLLAAGSRPVAPAGVTR